MHGLIPPDKDAWLLHSIAMLPKKPPAHVTDRAREQAPAVLDALGSKASSCTQLCIRVHTYIPSS